MNFELRFQQPILNGRSTESLGATSASTRIGPCDSASVISSESAVVPKSSDLPGFTRPTGPLSPPIDHGYSAIGQLEGDVSSNSRLPRHGLGYIMTLYPWGYQISALVVAFASFIGLVAMAAKFSDRPLSEWKVPFISINALAAILATTMRGALLVPVADCTGQAKWAWFAKRLREPHDLKKPRSKPLHDFQYIDDVSRGPWGGFIWLSRNLLRPNYISIGALITVFSAGLSFFSQQLITVNIRNIVDPDGTAHVIWARNISHVDETLLMTAVYAGLVGADLSDPPVTCSTANCTWELVPSLGVCGNCQDITDKMTEDWINCSGAFCNYTSSSTGKDWVDDPYKLRHGPRPDTNFTLGRTPTHGNVKPQTFNVTRTSILPLDRSSYAPMDHPASYGPEENGFAMLFNGFEVVNIPFKFGWVDDWTILQYYSGTPSVTQCRFWYCMKAYEVNVTSGKIYQSVRNGEERHDNSTEPVVRFTNRDDFNMRNNTFSVEQGDNWSVSVGAALNLYRFMVGSEYGIAYAWGELGGRQNMTDTSIEFWNNALEDLDGWVDGVANSLTNFMRLQNQVPVEDDVYAGKAWVQQAYIRVDWLWIIYPTVAITATLLYLATSIAQTLRLDRKVWGNGVLPFLLFNVDDAIRERGLDACRTNDELMKAIGKDTVRFDGFGR